MNMGKTTIGVPLLLFLTWSGVQAASVSWIPGETPPKQWTIDPVNPSTSDVITFSGPTDVYSNVCAAESAMGGTPQLIIDEGSRVILLWFRPPASPICPQDWDPVAGLQGEFGPLGPGEWLLISLSKVLDLEITFTVQDAVAHYVDGDAPGPLHNGKSWAAAFRTLQEALAVAHSSDRILVAKGVYKPDQGGRVIPGDREATFQLADGLLVMGGFAGYGMPDPDARDPAVYETVLDGDLRGNDLFGLLNRDDNSYHVVTGPAGGTAVLDGFHVRFGTADGPYPHHYGGGLYNPGGAMEVAYCTFSGNHAAFGAGIMNRGGPITIANTQIIDNRAFAFGGGLYNYEGHTALHNVRIVGNTADYTETIGSAAIYNLNGNLTAVNATIADNLSPIGRAIVHLGWGPPGSSGIEVANSILFNGGDELWSNDLGAVEVAYSAVEGDWPGTGNIADDPQFAKRGTRGIEGEWIDGDYRLQATSPAIDAGSDRLLPPDLLDLDEDADTAEPLPVDLDNEPRIEGTQVDMGAYEQLAKKPGPLPDVDLVFCLDGRCLALEPDPGAPSGSNTFIGSALLRVELNFRVRFSATARATSAAGGTWTAWVDPDTIGPGDVTTTLWVRGENLDLAALPAGSQEVQVAAVELSVVLVP